LCQVSVEAVTRALVGLFSSLCSCTVLTDDVTVSSYTQVEGVVYYRGFIVSPQADNIVTNLSHYIQTGQAILHLYGSYSLGFLINCPVRVLDGVCRISTADSSTLRCDSLANSTTLHYTTTTDKLSAVCVLIISVLAGLLLIAVLLLLTILIRKRFHRRKAIFSEENGCDRSPIQCSSYCKHDHTSTNGHHAVILANLPSRSSISSFHNGLIPSDTQQLTSNRKVPRKRSSNQRPHSSHESAYSDDSPTAEREAVDLIDYYSDQEGQERGVTSV
jgi:hypothetical protein